MATRFNHESANAAPSGLVSTSALLSSDVWDQVFSYLPSESYAYKARCLNDRNVLKASQRRKRAFFDSHGKVPLSWPSTLILLPLTDLEICALDRPDSGQAIRDFDGMSVHNLPSTLTRLVFMVPMLTSPFCVAVASNGPSKLEELNTCLPNLRTLETYHPEKTPFWVVPPSLTSLVSSGGQFHKDIPLPPLRVLCASSCSLPHQLMLQIAPTLEKLHILASSLNDIPQLPSLTHLHIAQDSFASLNYDIIEERCPNLRVFLGFESPLQEVEHKFNRVEYLYAPLLSSKHALPRSITQLTSDSLSQEDHTPSLLPIHHLNVHQLPSCIRKLRIAKYSSHTINDARNLFFSGLTVLDVSSVMIAPDQFQFLPTSLTTLHLSNITTKNVGYIARLNLLRYLGWSEGILTTKVARQLPRTITALTLKHVALLTKGHYQVPGSTDYHTYSCKNPQLNALRELPAVKRFVLIPGRFTYYHTATYPIVSALPTSIESLILDFEFHPFGLIPSNGFGMDFSQAHQRPDMFARFKSLNHLYLQCGSIYLGNGFLDCLPKSIRALRLTYWIWNTLKGSHEANGSATSSTTPSASSSSPSNFLSPHIFSNSNVTGWSYHKPQYPFTTYYDNFPGAYDPLCLYPDAIKCD